MNISLIIKNETGWAHFIEHLCIDIVMPIAVGVGIIGNLLSICVFARREMIKFCVSILTIVLSLSDILLLITSIFNIVLPAYNHYQFADKSLFWCHFHGYFDLLFASLSGYSMVFISVERWFSVLKPFDKAKYITFKSTITTVIIYIIVSSIVCLWYPLILKFDPYHPDPNLRCRLLEKFRKIFTIFGTINVLFTYIVPFTILGILNSFIIHRLRARQNNSIRSTHSERNSSSIRTRTRQRQNTDRNITFMLITVALAFMLMSFPYQIYWFYLQISQTTSNKTLYTLTQTFRNLNCMINFFLYSATSSLFRRELKEIFHCCYLLSSSKSNSLPNTEQTLLPKDSVKLQKKNSNTITDTTSPKSLTKNGLITTKTENNHLLGECIDIELNNGSNNKK